MVNFSNASLESICDEEKHYLYNLIVDYYKAISSFGFIALEDFIHSWNCIPLAAFSNLPIGTTVYDYNGKPYKTVDYVYEYDDKTSLYVECAPIDDEGFMDTKHTEIMTCGYLYTSPYVNDVYSMTKKKRKDGEKICPILITKTKQLQN
mgnify:FL=1